MLGEIYEELIGIGGHLVKKAACLGQRIMRIGASSNYMSKLKISSVFLMSQCSEDEVQCISCACMIGDLEHRISSHFVG